MWWRGGVSLTYTVRDARRYIDQARTDGAARVVKHDNNYHRRDRSNDRSLSHAVRCPIEFVFNLLRRRRRIGTRDITVRVVIRGAVRDYRRMIIKPQIPEINRLL